MKNYIINLFVFLALFAQGQKKELRNIDKLINESFFKEAKFELDKIESIIETSEDKYKAQFYYYTTIANYELESFDKSLKSYQILKNLNPTYYNSKIKDNINLLPSKITNSLVNSAIDDNKEGDYLEASNKLFIAYNINPESNVDYLYFAASSAVNGKDYDKALKYYIDLKEKNYTGVVDLYFITNKSSGSEEEVSKSEFEILKTSKDYTNPRSTKSESRYPEIVKNIALIYVQQGKNEIAIEAINEARKIQPNDISLLLNEADLYIKISNKSQDEEEKLFYRNKFKSIMENAIKLDPENGILYYNLGVIYAEQGEYELSKEKYRQAIELKPDYVDAYLNLVTVILEAEKNIVDEMNSLGNSKKDNIRYDALKVSRENLYKECVPLLERLIEISPKSLDALNTLKNIYGVLGNNTRFMQIKAKIEEIESN